MEREKFLSKIESTLRVHHACALLGPRQVGKTTLAEMYIAKHPKEKVQFFDLENPIDLSKLDNPMLALASLDQQLIVIDEIQRRPELFPVLRVLMDDKKKSRKFLILGSASRDLIRQSSETLAGRVGFVELTPFSTDEVSDLELLFLRGGFPRSYLADREEDSFDWRQAYITTFLERDIPSLGFDIPAPQMRRFWLMLAHYHGQLFNASELGKSLGISDHTVKRYLDILTGTFMIRRLNPWFENLSKRQVKSPKIYFRDSGILHALLNIKNREELETYPKLGSFWEGFALEETIHALGATPEEAFFWATQSGAELDLFIFKGGKRLGFEFKYTDRPKITASMQIACVDLKLDHLTVIIPGDHQFPLSDKISVQGLKSIKSTL